MQTVGCKHAGREQLPFELQPETAHTPIVPACSYKKSTAFAPRPISTPHAPLALGGLDSAVAAPAGQAVAGEGVAREARLGLQLPTHAAALLYDRNTTPQHAQHTARERVWEGEPTSSRALVQAC